MTPTPDETGRFVFTGPDLTTNLTPRDAQVRGRYCDGVYAQTGHTTEGEDFDRWLAQHDAEIAAKALREAAHQAPVHNNQVIGGKDLRNWLRARADRIERGVRE